MRIKYESMFRMRYFNIPVKSKTAANNFEPKAPSLLTLD